MAATILTVEGNSKIVDGAPGLFPGDSITEATYMAYQSDKDTIGLQINGSADGTMLDALPAEMFPIEINASDGIVDENAGCLVCHEPHAGGADNCISCHELDDAGNDEEEPVGQLHPLP